MADHSKIEWTDATWNIITGCSVVSAGCTNCYAMKLAGGRLRHHASRAGLTIDTKAGPVWNGEVRFNEQWLDVPLRWRRPRMIFVCAHGDLFHEAVPDAWIDRVFAIMAFCPQHTFQVLTKRPERAERYERSGHVRDVCYRPERYFSPVGDPTVGRGLAKWPDRWPGWPIPNVWLGTSCEDQATADERIPHLLDTPAAVRFVSLEPLLGPIDLGEWVEGYGVSGGGLHPIEPEDAAPPLHWVIIGGESGPAARHHHLDWSRSIIRQCRGAGVPVFVKQLGARSVQGGDVDTLLTSYPIRDSKGGDPAEWPEDLRVRELPAIVHHQK